MKNKNLMIRDTRYMMQIPKSAVRPIIVLLMLALVGGTLYYYDHVRALGGGGMPRGGGSHALRQPSGLAGTDLKGWWKFDGDATDSSGNANTGTVSNATLTRGAKFDQAYDFNGTTSLINAGSATVFDDMAALTVSAWIKADTSGEGTFGMVADKSDGSTPINGWSIYLGPASTPQINFEVDYATTDLVRITSIDTIPLGVWTHVVLTWDGSTTAANADFYLNGVEASYATTTNGAGARQTDAAQNLNIGNNTITDQTFDGVIDDVRVYNVVFTSAQIAELYRSSAPPAFDQTALGYWNLDETTGQTVSDATGKISGCTRGATSASAADDPTQNSHGTFQSAYSFDAGDMVNCGDVLDFNRTDTRTFAAWIYPRVVAVGSKHIVSKEDAASPFTGWHVSLFDQSANIARVHFQYRATTTLFEVQTSSRVIAIDTWYHVVVVYDNQTVKMYVNGLEQTTTVVTNTLDTNVDNTDPFNIGANDNNTTEAFDGNIEDVRIYNRLLQPYEIVDQYLAGRP